MKHSRPLSPSSLVSSVPSVPRLPSLRRCVHWGCTTNTNTTTTPNTNTNTTNDSTTLFLTVVPSLPIPYHGGTRTELRQDTYQLLHASCSHYSTTYSTTVPCISPFPRACITHSTLHLSIHTPQNTVKPRISTSARGCCSLPESDERMNRLPRAAASQPPPHPSHTYT